MTEDSRPPQVCPNRNNGTDQVVAHLAQTVAALFISRAKMRLLEASSLPVFTESLLRQPLRLTLMRTIKEDYRSVDKRCSIRLWRDVGRTRLQRSHPG